MSTETETEQEKTVTFNGQHITEFCEDVIAGKMELRARKSETSVGIGYTNIVRSILKRERTAGNAVAWVAFANFVAMLCFLTIKLYGGEAPEKEVLGFGGLWIITSASLITIIASSRSEWTRLEGEHVLNWCRQAEKGPVGILALSMELTERCGKALAVSRILSGVVLTYTAVVTITWLKLFDVLNQGVWIVPFAGLLVGGLWIGLVRLRSIEYEVRSDAQDWKEFVTGSQDTPLKFVWMINNLGALLK